MSKDEWKIINSNVARNVREFREARGWTEDKLGKLINVTKSTVCRIENDKLRRIIDQQHLNNLAKVFEVSTDVLTETNADYHYKLNEIQQRFRNFETGNQLLVEAKLFVEYATGRGKIELAKALQMLGSVHFVREEYQLAYECYEKALCQVEHSFHDYIMLSEQLKRNKFDCLLRLSRFEELQQFVDQEFESIRSVETKAKMLISYGTVFIKRKEFSVAENHIQNGLRDIEHTEENIVHIGRATQLLSTIYQQTGLFEKAMSFAEDALSFAERCGDHLCSVYCMRVIGEVKLKLNDKAEAQVVFEKALEIAQEKNHGNIDICLLKYSIAQCETSPINSYRKLVELMPIAESANLFKTDLVEIYTVIAELAHDLEEFSESQKYYRLALKTMQK